MPWKCKHTRSAENTQKNGRCLTCHREAQGRYQGTAKGISTRVKYDRSLKGRIRENLYKANKRLETNG